MIALLLAQAAEPQKPPLVLRPPDTISEPVQATGWECDLTGPWQTRIAGTFGAVEASAGKPVADPKPQLIVTSDADGLLSGEIQRQGYHSGGVYFFQFWTGYQVRSFTFDFRGNDRVRKVRYWAGSNGTGTCRVNKLNGERA